MIDISGKNIEDLDKKFKDLKSLLNKWGYKIENIDCIEILFNYNSGLSIRIGYSQID